MTSMMIKMVIVKTMAQYKEHDRNTDEDDDGDDNLDEHDHLTPGKNQHYQPGLRLVKGSENCPMKSSSRPTSSSKTTNLIIASSGIRRSFLNFCSSHTGLKPAEVN